MLPAPAFRTLIPWLALSLSSCSQIEVPVWLIRADKEMTVAEADRAVARAFDELNWPVAQYDPESRRIATRWRYRDGIWGGVRTRVEAQLSANSPFEIALSVPREVHDGRRWVVRGEDEAGREEIVATMTARLHRPAEPRP